MPAKYRNWRSIISLIILIFYAREFSAEATYRIIEKKELPNNLGTFRQIQFKTKKEDAIILYAATLNANYYSTFFLQESKWQIFADYLDEISRTQDFTIAINGSFYQPDFTPLGLFIYQGKTLKPRLRNSLLKACVMINDQQKIVLTLNLEECLPAKYAMQAGPLLLSAGKISKHLTSIQQRLKSMADFFAPHKRTLLATTSNGQLIIMTTSAVALQDLAEFLQDHPTALGVSKIDVAVNLDGGSSTGMYVRFKNQPFYYHELKHVKSFIFIK